MRGVFSFAKKAELTIERENIETFFRWNRNKVRAFNRNIENGEEFMTWNKLH